MIFRDFPHNDNHNIGTLPSPPPPAQFSIFFSLKYPDLQFRKKGIYKHLETYASLITRTVIVFSKCFIQWETFNLLKYMR